MTLARSILKEDQKQGPYFQFISEDYLAGLLVDPERGVQAVHDLYAPLVTAAKALREGSANWSDEWSDEQVVEVTNKGVRRVTWVGVLRGIVKAIPDEDGE